MQHIDELVLARVRVAEEDWPPGAMRVRFDAKIGKLGVIADPPVPAALVLRAVWLREKGRVALWQRQRIESRVLRHGRAPFARDSAAARASRNSNTAPPEGEPGRSAFSRPRDAAFRLGG